MKRRGERRYFFRTDRAVEARKNQALRRFSNSSDKKIKKILKYLLRPLRSVAF